MATMTTVALNCVEVRNGSHHDESMHAMDSELSPQSPEQELVLHRQGRRDLRSHRDQGRYAVQPHDPRAFLIRHQLELEMEEKNNMQILATQQVMAARQQAEHLWAQYVHVSQQLFQSVEMMKQMQSEMVSIGAERDGFERAAHQLQHALSTTQEQRSQLESMVERSHNVLTEFRSAGELQYNELLHQRSINSQLMQELQLVPERTPGSTS